MLQNLLNPGIKIGNMTITYYAICIVSGMLVAFGLITLLFKRRNMSPDLFLTLFCVCLPICLITTRLFYCITAPLPIGEWFNLKKIFGGEGLAGLSIVGGILGGLISVFSFCMIKKINFFRVGDCVVVGLLVAQAMGRWGNFFNQEVYGGVVENPALQWFPIAVNIDGTYHYAFFFYESVFNLAIAALLFWNAWKNPYKPNGVNTAAYFTSYGLIRSIMEPLRDPTYILGEESGIQWSFVCSLLMLIGGMIWLATLFIINKKKHGKLVGAVSGNPYGITEFIKDTKEEIPVYTKVNMMCKVYPENYESPEDTAARLAKEREGKVSFWEKVKAIFTKNKKDDEQK